MLFRIIWVKCGSMEGRCVIHVMDRHKKIKVLFVAPAPPPYTGLEVMSQFFLKSRLKDEFQIIYLRSNLNKHNRHRGKVRAANFCRFMLLCTRLLCAILKDNPQIVYTILSENATGFLRSFAVVVISKICGKKIVVHLYGANFMLFYKHSNKLLKNMIKYTMKCISRAIVPGFALKNQFDGIYDSDKIGIIYNAVAGEKFILPQNRLNNKSEGIQVLFVGLLSQAKGFNDVIKSIPLIFERCPTVQFAFVGERIKIERHILLDCFGKKILFEDTEEFLKKLKGQYSSNIRFLGVVKEEEKEKLFIESDIFVLPSYSEAFPVAILEAMGYGLPIVTTPVGAMPEILKDVTNCFFIPIGDYKMLAERIIYLVNNPDVRLQMGRNNYSLIKNDLNINKSAKAMSDIFKEISLM